MLDPPTQTRRIQKSLATLIALTWPAPSPPPVQAQDGGRRAAAGLLSAGRRMISARGGLGGALGPPLRQPGPASPTLPPLRRQGASAAVWLSFFFISVPAALGEGPVCNQLVLKFLTTKGQS